MPIKTYSSGMKSRLGFGLSMAFYFDYYLVDEVMAVGDAKFKSKCDYIFKEKNNESSFLMVSHSLNSLKNFCNSALYIGRDNKVEYMESVDEAINKYINHEGL